MARRVSAWAGAGAHASAGSRAARAARARPELADSESRRRRQLRVALCRSPCDEGRPSHDDGDRRRARPFVRREVRNSAPGFQVRTRRTRNLGGLGIREDPESSGGVGRFVCLKLRKPITNPSRFRTRGTTRHSARRRIEESPAAAHPWCPSHVSESR